MWGKLCLSSLNTGVNGMLRPSRGPGKPRNRCFLLDMAYSPEYLATLVMHAIQRQLLAEVNVLQPPLALLCQSLTSSDDPCSQCPYPLPCLGIRTTDPTSEHKHPKAHL
jgi:hypothetical protein